MLVGWLKVRRTDYKTFEKHMSHALSIILGYLVCWFWNAYFMPKDHYIIGRPHGATILDRIMKNETANPPTHPPPCQIMDDTAQKPNAPSLFEGEEVWISHLFSYKHRRQPGEKRNIIIRHSRLRDEIPAPGSSVPRTLEKGKPRWQTSEGQRDL